MTDDATVGEQRHDRRALLRTAIVGGGVVWATPVVQSVGVPPALAGSPACDTSADPTSTTGIVILDPSGSYNLRKGGQENTLVQLLREQTKAVTDLKVDISSPGSYPGGGVSGLTPDTITADGITSWIAHYNPVSDSGTKTRTAQIVWPSTVQILGLIVTNENNVPRSGDSRQLNESDGIVGHTSTTYEDDLGRRTGYTSESSDDIQLGTRQLDLVMQISNNNIDDVRIIVGCA